MSPVEGWYPDPAGNPSLERYWDGAVWTSNTRPVGGQASPPPPPPPGPGQAPPPPPGPAMTAPGTPAMTPPSPAPGPGPIPAPPPGPGPEPMAPMGGDLGGFEPAPISAPAGAAPAPPAPTVADVTAPSAPSQGITAVAGVGGISTELLTDSRFAENQSNERVVRQNSRLLKIRLGEDILAKQGSMVAFQGQIDFDHEGSGAAKFLKKAMTGEGLPLMRCSGQGELFLADNGHQVHIITLEGAGLTVNGRNVLAFEPSLSWDIERIKGAGMMAGGLFNTRLEGHGWVAITTDGDPVVLQTDQPTFADTDAAVAWSSSLTTSINRTVKAQALVGRGSGEVAQLAFQGQGIVIVQPSEGGSVPPHSH